MMKDSSCLVWLVDPIFQYTLYVCTWMSVQLRGQWGPSMTKAFVVAESTLKNSELG